MSFDDNKKIQEFKDNIIGIFGQQKIYKIEEACQLTEEKTIKLFLDLETENEKIRRAVIQYWTEQVLQHFLFSYMPSVFIPAFYIELIFPKEKQELKNSYYIYISEYILKIKNIPLSYFYKDSLGTGSEKYLTDFYQQFRQVYRQCLFKKILSYGVLFLLAGLLLGLFIGIPIGKSIVIPSEVSSQESSVISQSSEKKPDTMEKQNRT